MSRNTIKTHFNLHPSAMSAIDIQISGFGTNHKIRPDAILFNDVFPAKSVAVLFHNATHKIYCQILIESQLLKDTAGSNK